MKPIFYLLLILLVTGSISAQPDSPFNLTDYPATQQTMLTEMVNSTSGTGDPAVFAAVGTSGDPLYIAPLLDLAFFVRSMQNPVQVSIFDAVQTLTGQDFERNWEAYFKWASANNLALPPGYTEFKGSLYGYLDPAYQRFFNPTYEAIAQINLQELLWGGLPLDTAPSLDNPEQVAPNQALIEGDTMQNFCRQGDCAYPAFDEYVFGVTLNGDTRAYPLRILNWHPVVNDVFGMTPLYDQPDGAVLCQYRAPRPFKTIARQGDAWVQIVGKSAGCPVGIRGWLKVSDLTWDSPWSTIREQLPDTGAEALKVAEGIDGQVNGIPVTLMYCALCGSGVLFASTLPASETGLEFNASGLILRSSQLLYDRQTNSLWNGLTGEAVFGALAGNKLQQLPVVVADWGSWLNAHPDTGVLSLFTGYQRQYATGAAYSAYFNTPDQLLFPVWQQKTDVLSNKTMIFALNLNDTTRAYPLNILIAEGVINDLLGDTEVVLITRPNAVREFLEPGGAEVRAYRRVGHTFSKGENRSTLLDEQGMSWTITEAALIAPDGTKLERLPGHLVYWFAWYAFYPQTDIYGGI